MSEKTEMLTIRVPKGTKAKIKRAKINLSADVRNLIDVKVRATTFLDVYKKIEARARKRRVSGDSTKMVREDRDSR